MIINVLCSSDGQRETEPSVHVHQSQQTTQVVGSPVTIHPSITEEGGTNLIKESNMLSQNQHPLAVEHANAPSGDVKVVTVTGSSSHHSSFVQLSKQPVSPPLSSSMSTGMHSVILYV